KGATGATNLQQFRNTKYSRRDREQAIKPVWAAPDRKDAKTRRRKEFNHFLCAFASLRLRDIDASRWEDRPCYFVAVPSTAFPSALKNRITSFAYLNCTCSSARWITVCDTAVICTSVNTYCTRSAGFPATSARTVTV